jgi:hypothetical protein
MADYKEWDRLVGLFRGKSPNIAKAFDQAKAHTIRQDNELTALAATNAGSGVVYSPTASPGSGTAQTLLASLAAGQTGYLRGGTYTTGASYILDFTASITGRTIMAYPGETVVLQGLIVVRAGAHSSRIKNLTIQGTAGASNTIQVLAANNVMIEDNLITNANAGRSGILLGDASNEVGTPIIRRNVIYDCGQAANNDQDHGIYAAKVQGGLVTDNLFFGITGYHLHLYPSCQGVTFSHNVMDGGGIQCTTPNVACVLFGAEAVTPTSNNIVEYSVITNATAYNVSSYWGGTPGSGNVVRDCCLYHDGHGGYSNFGPQTGWSQSSNTQADPLYVNRAADNYRLQEGTPALAEVVYDTAALLDYP